MKDRVGRGAQRFQMATGAPEANNGVLSCSGFRGVAQEGQPIPGGDEDALLGVRLSRTRSSRRDLEREAGARRGRGPAGQVRPAPPRPLPPRRPRPPRPRLLPSLQRSPRSPILQPPPAAASAQTAKLSKSCGKGTSDRVGAGAVRGLRAPGERTLLCTAASAAPLQPAAPSLREPGIPPAWPLRVSPSPRPWGGTDSPSKVSLPGAGFPLLGGGTRGWADGAPGGGGRVREVRGQGGRAPAPSFGGSLDACGWKVRFAKLDLRGEEPAALRACGGRREQLSSLGSGAMRCRAERRADVPGALGFCVLAAPALSPGRPPPRVSPTPRPPGPSPTQLLSPPPRASGTPGLAVVGGGGGVCGLWGEETHQGEGGWWWRGTDSRDYLEVRVERNWDRDARGGWKHP